MDVVLSGTNGNTQPPVVGGSSSGDGGGGGSVNGAITDGSPIGIVSNNALITASNVINSCAQYTNNLSSNIPIVNANAVNAAANVVSGGSQPTEDTEMRHRFKVVKLVSSQPYTRGRWTCFDYNDENQNTINIAKHVPANKILPNGHPDGAATCGAVDASGGPAPGNNTSSDQSEVAIDNKIEQAMDLVKSHLMFAVREEVDVLKERIKELESDIQILIAHATPETLALLSNRSTSSAAPPATTEQ